LAGSQPFTEPSENPVTTLPLRMLRRTRRHMYSLFVCHGAAEPFPTPSSAILVAGFPLKENLSE
jgi:hypothetical protein